MATWFAGTSGLACPAWKPAANALAACVEAARDWFDQSEDEQFLLCRFTQLALLRFLTNKSVMGRDAKTMAAAWEIYDQCLTEERIAFLAEPQGTDPKLAANLL